MSDARIDIPRDQIVQFCRTWDIAEFSLFGSVLRDYFGPESDIDVLVKFSDDAGHSILDLVHMETELSAILGRRADLVDRRAVERSENYIRRRHVLEAAESVYVAG